MEPFEEFRAYLVRRLAAQLSIAVDNRTVWELWLAINEECSEAARIASEQWLESDLLAEHLLFDDRVRNLIDTATTELETGQLSSELADYLRKWQQFNIRIQVAIAKREQVTMDSFLST